MDSPNRVIIERYPVDNLPDDLREGRDPGTEVRIVVESIPSSDPQTVPMTSILDEMQDRRVSSKDPAERIRALRAEWDRREEFHERIRTGHGE